MPHRIWIAALVILMVTPPAAHARKWSDPTGKFSVEGRLVAFNDKAVVLQRDDHELIEVQIDQLSKEDQDFISDHVAEASEKGAPEGLQTWTLQNGMKFEGKVVGYTKRDVNIQRRRGKIYVNDRLLENYPNLYRKMLPKIVAHFEMNDLETEKDLKSWVTNLRGAPRSYSVEGVMLELNTGDEHAVPFFFFSADDLKVLQQGWDRWQAAQDKHEEQSREDLALQAQAEAYQRGLREGQQQAASQGRRSGPGQVSAMDLMAVEAGVTDLWEVTLTSGGRSIKVVVPGRDSRAATIAAQQKYPGASVGPIRKLN